MVKIEDSAAIKPNIPARPREGSFHSSMAARDCNWLSGVIHTSNQDHPDVSGPKAAGCCEPWESQRSYRQEGETRSTTRASKHPTDHYRRSHRGSTPGKGSPTTPEPQGLGRRLQPSRSDSRCPSHALARRYKCGAACPATREYA